MEILPTNPLELCSLGLSKNLLNIILTFFGAKKEAKKHPPNQAFPIWKDVT